MLTSPAFKATFFSFLISLFALSSTIATAADEDLDQMLVAELLTQEKAPDGVVFELIGNEGDYLLNAIKKVETYKEQLQKKFPKLEIAVVSHGSEQFNLTKAKAEKSEAKETHTRVQRLVESDVPVHICAVHASWRDVAPEDFPEYISVSSTGPAEIRNYQEFGFQLIVVD
jgi:intracellular sulfur oxidation DsrE/DsrF family protein